MKKTVSVERFCCLNKSRITYIIFGVFLLVGKLSMAQVPVISDLSLEATSPGNLTIDSLICTYTPGASATETASAWYRNGTPERLLYLPFEGGSTNILLDFSGRNNHASTTGNATEVPSWDPTGGPDGSGAFIFDGDDYLLAGDIFPLNSPYTKTAWISVTGDDYRNIISSLYNGECDHHFKVNPDGTLNAGHSFGEPIVQDAIPLNSDQWYFVAVTFDYASGEMVLYKDGLEVDRDIVHETLRSISDETVLIGARDNIWGWNGSMDEPCIYDRALSAEQIHSLYINGNNVIVPEETRGSDVWYVNVTPFSLSEVGTTYTSNTITLQEPRIIGLSLDASSAENWSTDNLISSYTTNGSVTQTASAWYRNGTPERLLYLPFEGGSTNALLDFSGSNNHVSTTGVITSIPSWDATSGPDGSGAFTFDGDDYLLADDIFPLNSPYTKTAWISVTGDDYRNIISSLYNGERDHHFKVNPDGTLNAGHSFGASIVQDATPLNPDQWYFVAVTFDFASGEMVLYKDGLEVDRDYVPEALRSVADETVLIGARDNIWGWKGSMDEPCLYDRALSAEQISSLYINGNNVIVPEETRGSDVWYVNVTPFSIFEVGTTYTSNTITVQEPEIIGLSLDASSAENLTIDNLISSYTTNGSVTQTASAWYRNGAPESLLYLPFEGGSTNALLDFSGSNNHVSTTGVITEVPSWDATSGPDGSGAFTFDGDDYLLAGDIFPLSSAYTKTAWINMTGSGYRNIMSSILHDDNNHTFKVDPSGIVGAGHSFGATVVQDVTPLSHDQWYFVAVTFDYLSGEMILYRDGIEIDRDIVPEALRSVADASVLIGAMDGSYIWQGSMDEPRLYDHVLSAEQISSLFNIGNSVITSEETESMDEWYVDVTPFSIFEIGSTYTSNTVTIHSVVVSDIPNQTVNEGATFSAIDLDDYVVDYEYDDSDLTWSSTGNSELIVNIDPVTHVATIDIPDINWYGSENISFTASNPKTDSDETEVIFTVQNINDAPVLTFNGGEITDEDNTITGISVVFSDLDPSDAHTISIVSSDPNVTVEHLSGHISSSTYDLEPAENWNGTSQITVTVTDNGTGTLSDSETYILMINPINDAPVLTEVGNQIGNEDNSLIGLSVVFTDPDAADLHTISVVSDEANVSVESLSGHISGSTYDLVPAEDWNGSAQITVTVTDNGTGILSDSETYTFTVNAINDAPVLTEIGNQTVNEDNTLSGLSVVFTDIDASDAHTIAVVSDEANVSVESLSGNTSGSTYDLVPFADWIGTAQITVTVTDNGSGALSVSETYTLTVHETNDAPVLTLIGDQAIDEDNTLSGLSVIFTDLEAFDTHTIAVVSNEANVSVLNLSGHISGSTYDLVPEADWNGTAQITVTVTDDGPGTLFDSETYTLTVNATGDAPVLTLIGDQATDEDNTLGLSVIFTDPDVSDVHTITVVSDEANVSVENLSGHISGSTYDLVPATDWNGTAQITVTVTDNGSGALSDLETYTLTVNAINDTPVSLDLSNKVFDEKVEPGTDVGLFTSIDIDIDDTHQYQLISGAMDNDNDAFIIVGDTLKTNAEFDFETQSIYWIRVQTEDGQGATTSQPFIISLNDIDETSVDQVNNPLSFNVYPVPAFDKVTVEIDNPENRELILEIYTNTGTLVHSENTFNGNTIDLSAFADGMYFLTVRGESVYGTRKIIVKDR